MTLPSRSANSRAAGVKLLSPGVLLVEALPVRDEEDPVEKMPAPAPPFIRDLFLLFLRILTPGLHGNLRLFRLPWLLAQLT